MNDKSNKPSGLFSLSLQSVEWQIKNLFQEAGGDKAVELMDRLAGIPESEREMLLEKFLNVVSKFVSAQPGKVNTSACDGSAAVERKIFGIEDQIVNDVLAALEGPRRLAVVDGGKTERRSAGRLIDFAAAKKVRSDRVESSLN